jgi:cytochrome c-type biogenesis protein CcmE
MSSSLDKELAEAIEESEAQATDPVVGTTTSKAAPNRPRKSLGLLIALLVMAGTLLALVLTSFDGAAIYSKGVDELVRGGSAVKDRTIRVQGILVKGTLVRRDQPCEYRFHMKKNGADIEVRYPQCVVPDTFRDVPNMDVEVTATGKISEAGYFQASQIMAKCPSKYEMKQLAEGGEKAPHGQIVRAGSMPVQKTN